MDAHLKEDIEALLKTSEDQRNAGKVLCRRAEKLNKAIKAAHLGMPLQNRKCRQPHCIRSKVRSAKTKGARF